MGFNWNFQRGGGIQTKKPSVGGVWTFSGTTHYLFQEANSFLRAKLEENCQLRGADNVQGQINMHIFEAK